MHVRAQPGTRIEETTRLLEQIEQTVRATIRPDQLENIGLPFSGINRPARTPERSGPKTATPCDVANSLLVTLSGIGQVERNFWLNTEDGVSYPIVAQMRQYRVNCISDLSNIPITASDGKASVLDSAFVPSPYSPATHQRFLVCCRTGEPVIQEKCLCLTPIPKMFSPN